MSVQERLEAVELALLDRASGSTTTLTLRASWRAAISTRSNKSRSSRSAGANSKNPYGSLVSLSTDPSTG
jgi:hypothetical protein